MAAAVGAIWAPQGGSESAGAPTHPERVVADGVWASPMSSDDGDARARRRRPDRIGDLLPATARRFGLEDELRLARAIATWDALVAERVPPAVGACRLVALEPDTVVVEADEPIVAAELRMRAMELLAAFASAPGGTAARFLRLTGGSSGGRGSGPRRV